MVVCGGSMVVLWWLNGSSWWLNGSSWWLNGSSWWLNGILWWLNGSAPDCGGSMVVRQIVVAQL
jgi:hypothetical protein